MTRKTFWLRVATFIENRGVELTELAAALEKRGDELKWTARRLNRRVNPPPPPVPVDLAEVSRLIRETWNTSSFRRRYLETWKDFLGPIEWAPVPDLFAAPARDYSNDRDGMIPVITHSTQRFTIIDEGWSPWTPVHGAPLGDWLEKHIPRPT